MTLEQLEALATSSESVSTSLPSPLSPKDRFFIKALADRYEGKDGMPVMTFDRDGVVTLITPADIRRKRPDATIPVSDSKTSGLRVRSTTSNPGIE